MNEKICINDVRVQIDEDALILHREKGFLSLTNSNNGFSSIKTIINHSTNYKDRDIAQNQEDIKKILKTKSISDNASIMITCADIKEIAIKTYNNVTAIVSAHIKDVSGVEELINKKIVSTNIILLINGDLDYNSLLNCYTRVIESKVASLWDLDVRNPFGDLSVGNFSDSIIVACTGKSEEGVYNEIELYNSVSKCVREATEKALLNSGFSKSVLDFIEEIGIKIEDLVEAGMELLVGVEKSEDLYKKLHDQILKSLEDLNVVSFIIAGIRLEEDYMKHRVEGINVDDDPAYLYSDEVFGMSVANQIAGTKAIFNFKRYDEEKPGIIGELGPVLDDVFAGLIAGCMSKIFEE